MDKKYEFYPLITRTLKNLINLTPMDKWSELVLILLTYPDYPRNNLDNLENAVLSELDRQYARWNKGGGNGTR